MANIPQLNAMTSVDLANLIPEKWDSTIIHNAYQEAFWGGKFTAPEGGRLPIVEKEDFTKEVGDKIHIQTLSNLRGAGTSGETLQAGREEKLSAGTFSVTIERWSHAVALTDKANEISLMKDIMLAGKKLAPWLAQKLSDDVFKALLLTATGATTLFADGVANEDALSSTNIMDLDEVAILRLALKRKGTMPLVVRRKNGEIENWYGVVMSGIDEHRLVTSADWKQAQREANVRSEDNPLFTSALGVFAGCLLYSYEGIVAAADTKGTPLRPEAVTKTELAANGTTLYVGSGADDNIDYTRNFKSSGKLISGTEVLSYDGKTNYTFTNVSHDNATPKAILAGSTVTQRNVASVLGFGAEILARAWGLHPTKIADSQSYNQLMGVGLKAVYGVAAIKDTYEQYPNYVILKTYARNPGSV